MFAVYLNVGDVVLEDSWDVDLTLCISLYSGLLTRPREASVLGADRGGSDREKSSLRGCSYLWESALREDTVISKSAKSYRDTVGACVHLHQQTSLTTGTITDDDEFTSNLSHVRCRVSF